jgi:hypothetical protein
MQAIKFSLLTIAAAAVFAQPVLAQNAFSNMSMMDSDSNYGWQQLQFMPAQQPMTMQRPMQQQMQPLMQQQMMQQPANMFSGRPQNFNMASPPENPFTMQNLLKAFLGGSPTSPNDAARKRAEEQARKTADQQAKNAAEQYALGNVRCDLQIALDQACQAENDCGRATYGEKSYRLSAAYSAQCHADAARGAADRAAGTAYGKGSTVNDVACQTRNAANRAQAAADRARYNASVSQ